MRGGWLWETRYRMVGVGWKGVVRCPCSGETTNTHFPNLWHSAVWEADCVAQLLSRLQIMSPETEINDPTSKPMRLWLHSPKEKANPRESCVTHVFILQYKSTWRVKSVHSVTTKMSKCSFFTSSFVISCPSFRSWYEMADCEMANWSAPASFIARSQRRWKLCISKLLEQGVWGGSP